MQDTPPVSVIVPALRASAELRATLEAIVAQDYAGPLDVVVAVPDSEIRTAETMVDDPRIRFVVNPDGRTPTGLNAALSAAGGDVIVRCDTHARFPRDYVDTAVRTLLDTGAWNVGGVQRPVATGWFARAVAVAQSTPLGVGDARYRLGGAPGPVDTVYLGTFLRSALETVGGFDDTLDRNQDYELNIRLRQAGGIVWFDPELVVDYTPRPSIRSLARQYWDYGRWKRHVARLHPGTLRWRQLAAPTLVILLAISAVLIVTDRTIAGLLLPALYLGGLTATAGVEAIRRREPAALASPLAIMTMHLAWGLGFLLGQSRSAR